MRKLVIIVALCCLFFSCTSKEPKRTDSPGNLYVDGVNLMQAKKYDKAIQKFSAVRENYPFDPLAIVAAVKLGDAYFSKKEYVLASSVYEDFFKTHPEDENIPYALSKLGECYEKLSPSLDRDQGYTVKSIERLTYLKNRYPADPSTAQSEPRLQRMVQKLADRELYIGEFYYRSNEYNAAILRLEGLLVKYPGMKGLEKALFYLTMSYRELGNQAKSDEYADRLRNEYPKSLLSKNTMRERKVLKPALGLVKASEPKASLYEEKKERVISLAPPPPGAVAETSATPLQREGEETKTPESVTTSEKKGKTTVSDSNNEKGLSLAFDMKKPIDIASDTMEGFDKEKFVVFKGSVIAKQDDLFIFGDTMELYMSEETNDVDRVVIKGNVKIVKQDRTATCQEAFYENGKGQITLKGNVVVYQGQDKLTGDVIVFYVNEDRVVVQSDKDKRARITVQPKENP